MPDPRYRALSGYDVEEINEYYEMWMDGDSVFLVLTEPEDRIGGRDLLPALNRLNEQHEQLSEAQVRIAELERENASLRGTLKGITTRDVWESITLSEKESKLTAHQRHERLRLSRKELDKQGKEFLRSYKPEAVEGLSVKKE